MRIARAGSSLRKKIWLGALALGLFVSVLFVGNFFIGRDRAVTGDMLGHDFLAFYTAGHYARTGEYARIYDLESTRAFQKQTAGEAGLELGRSFGPFWNPPFYAWVFAPLAGLPYRAALAIWWGVNFACLAGAIVLLIRLFPTGTCWRTTGLVPLLVLISLPFQQAVSHAQNTFASLFLLTLTATFWLRATQSKIKNQKSKINHDFLAGLAAGLLLYKPQLGALVALILCLHLGRRAVLGVGITATAMLLVTIVTMPGIVEVYLQKMPSNLRWMQEENGYLWERHVTIKAFFRLLIQGHGTGPTWGVVKLLWWACAGSLGLLLGRAVWKWRRCGTPEGTGRLIAATITSMPLLMPFYFDYDLLLLCIPAVLHSVESSRIHPAEGKWLSRGWIALYCWTLVSPGLAGKIHFHLAAVLLAAVAVQQIRRAMERKIENSEEGGLAAELAAAA